METHASRMRGWRWRASLLLTAIAVAASACDHYETRPVEPDAEASDAGSDADADAEPNDAGDGATTD